MDRAKKGGFMTDLVVIFKDMIEAQDKAENLRLAGLLFRPDRVRGERLEKVFNDGMLVLDREKQMAVVQTLVLDGFLPPDVFDQMKYFGGTWAGFKTDYHRFALDVLGKIDSGGDPRTAVEIAAGHVKQLGISWDDFYKLMAEIRKILKIA